MACAKGELTAGDDDELTPLAGATDQGARTTSPDGGARDARAKDVAPGCKETDASYTTGNPGACAVGVQRCDGGVPVCVPVATTQPCYTGGASTRKVGA